MLECFGAEIAADRKERNHRFFEEATELVQACEMTRSEAHQLVDYVYGRPVGDAPQEVGAVMVTLAALCLANDFDMHAAGEVELARIWTKIEQIRAKQAAKPRHSPLPAAPQQKPVAWIDECDQMVVLEKFYKKHIGYVSEGRAIPDSWKPLCTAAPPPAPPVLSDEVTTYLQPRDMAALQRFFECCDDPDSGGHDVPKEAMARLREIGVVAYKPFGQHEITSFGDFVLGHTNGADFKFPLKTYAEYCEESKARAGYSNAADALLAKVRP
jgi:hypothetical protein